MYQHRVSTLVGSSWNPLVGPSSSPRLLLNRSPRLAVAAASNSHISTTTASFLYPSSSTSTSTAAASVHTPVAFLRSFSSGSAFASASASLARSRAVPMASPHSSESSAAPTPASSASSAHSSQTSLDSTSPVDMQENMKQAALDQHGHSQATGSQILGEPLWNKGLSFTPEERAAKNLTGLLPNAVESLQTQCARAVKMIQTRQTCIDKYLYLSNLKSENTDLFYRLLMDNIRDLMPLVYTPTIGDVCLQYSSLYTRPEALYISITQRNSIRTMLRNWPCSDPEICVVTDGSRILGLGDLGMNGVGIPIGKLSLYTAAAGIHPSKTLPIVLDCGTNNETNLQDPLYLGLRQNRPSAEAQQEFMDEFMEAVKEVYPKMVVQFEDFESQKAFNYLERYKNTHRAFNDDIQGTGAVILGGYIGAVNLSGVPIQDQRLVFMGAGSAGVGVAKQLLEYYTRRGFSEDEARSKFYLVDTKGLVTHDRGDTLAEHKKYFARTDNQGRQFRTLEEVIAHVQPSALVGLAATYGIFTESVIRALKASVDAGGSGRRPILFPLSNPLSKAECTFEEAIQWSDGSVIFASGSPFESLTIKTEGRGKDGSAEEVTYHPNQGNNVYVFPGLGLGAILAKASHITDDMVYACAEALAGTLNAEETQRGLIYPRIERVREASVTVAREVMKAARRGGVSEVEEGLWREWEERGDEALTAYIMQRSYDPVCFPDTKGRL